MNIHKLQYTTKSIINMKLMYLEAMENSSTYNKHNDLNSFQIILIMETLVVNIIIYINLVPMLGD